MLRKPILFLSLMSAAVISSPTIAGSRFGETFGATCLGTAVGSTVGTALGNAMSNPRPRREVRVVSEVVHVPVPVLPARRVRQLDREEQRLQVDIADLKSRKVSLERRVASLEQELNDIDASIDIKREALRSVREKKQELCEHVECEPTKKEIGEIKV